MEEGVCAVLTPTRNRTGFWTVFPFSWRSVWDMWERGWEVIPWGCCAPDEDVPRGLAVSSSAPRGKRDPDRKDPELLLAAAHVPTALGMLLKPQIHQQNLPGFPWHGVGLRLSHPCRDSRAMLPSSPCTTPNSLSRSPVLGLDTAGGGNPSQVCPNPMPQVPVGLSPVSSGTRVPGATKLSQHGQEKTLPAPCERLVSGGRLPRSWQVLAIGGSRCRFVPSPLVSCPVLCR